MSHPPDGHVRELDLTRALPIVVGAHLHAEQHDRPLAYALHERMAAILSDPGALVPVVCSDLWYLNSEPLRLQPTVALGAPEHNAATAFLAGRVPTALVVDDAYRIQLDPELIDLRACVWGIDPLRSTQGVEVFVERYLDDYLRAAELMAGV